MKKNLLGLFVYLCLFLVGCSEPDATINTSHIFSVSDYEFTLNQKQAVSISFGETESNYCSATIYRSSVSTGYQISSQANNNKDISIDCNWSGKYYVQSSKHPTSVNFQITSIDPPSKTAVALLSINLIEPSSGKYFKLNNTKLKIDEKHFANLVKKM